MTTIITKNGSGAPTAGQLTTGELAVDLTNKELYTKDSGGNVIKVGAQGGSSGTFTDLTATSSFTSPGIDDNANATAITIDSNENVGIGTSQPGSYNTNANDLVVGLSGTGGNRGLTIASGSTSLGTLAFANGPTGNDLARQFIRADHSSGDMLFATAAGEKMRIDATGNVGIGTDSPNAALNVSSTVNPTLRLDNPSGAARFNMYDSATFVGQVAASTGSGLELSAVGGRDISSYTNSIERMRIAASGNVGIGTASPTYAKTVIQANAVGVSPILALDNFEAGVGNEAVLSMGRSSTANRRVKIRAVGTGNNFVNPALAFDVNEVERMRIDAAGSISMTGNSWVKDNGTSRLTFDNDVGNTRIIATTTGFGAYEQLEMRASDFDWRIGTASKMKLDASGRVGIGTASPAGKQHTALATSHTWGSAWSDGTAVFGGAGSTSGALGISYNDTDGARLGAIAPGVAWKPIDLSGSELTFSVTGSEKMRIDSSGNLLVGKSSSNVNASGYEARSLGDVYSSITSVQNTYHVYDYTGGGFKFYVSGAGVISAGSSTITVLSDERLKENVRDLDDGLEKIMALQPRKFDWKEGKGLDVADDRGFIAQELETVFPDMVKDDGLNKDENGESYKTISPNLVPTLVKAIQEQQAMIETLQAEVAALKGA